MGHQATQNFSELAFSHFFFKRRGIDCPPQQVLDEGEKSKLRVALSTNFVNNLSSDFPIQVFCG